MTRLTVLTAALAASALIIAPAHAADLRVSSPTESVVRIPVSGKTTAQLTAEIKAAAETVCLEQDGLNVSCVSDAVADANEQLSAITASHHTSGSTSLQVMREGPTTVHIALRGKSATQIDSEILAAAQTVCTNATFDQSDYGTCVDAAVSDARYQLRSVVAQLDQPHDVATK